MRRRAHRGRPDAPALRTVLAGVLLALCPSAFALDPALDVSQYAHTAWKVRDGFAKGEIKSIAQTADGYLWLGTEFGLLRFDGVRAVPWQPPPDQPLPSSYVWSLLAARDGTLWIGTLKGLASWKDGRLTRYPELEGQVIFALLEDREGSVWVGGMALPHGKLCAIHQGTVECHGQEGNLGPGIFSLHEDRKGSLWVGLATGVWRWKPGPPKFYPVPGEPNGIRALAEDADGALLIGVRGGVRRLPEEGARLAYPFPGPLHQGQTTRILRDRDGGLWIGVDGGLVHVHQRRTDVFAQSDGLSGDTSNVLFEDSEGTIWVASLAGLDRFRDVAVATFGPAQGLSRVPVVAVLAGTDGSVWLATLGGLNRWSNGTITVPATGGASRDGKLNGLDPHSLFQDGRGRIWISTPGGIGYLEHDRFVAVGGVPGGNVRAIAQDAAGNVWIANQDHGLLRVSARGGVQQVSLGSLGHEDRATALLADPLRDGLWVGFYEGGIVHFAEGRVGPSYTAADGLGQGRVNALQLGPDGALWVATEGGLSRLKDGRVATLASASGLPCDAVHGVLEDDARSFWLDMPCGLVRIPRSELDTWTTAVDSDKSANRTIQATVFDSSDGVRLQGLARGYSPSSAKSSDGRLWFVSVDGVSVVDPRHLPFNKLPPPVHIEHVTADRKTYDAATATGSLLLPPLLRDLAIDYTATSLAAPEKVRFRYKLEGRDRDWQDAGSRRQAFYSDLPPRDYRFRVTACNNSGVWNEAGMFLDFSVAPAYYQTAWFRLSGVAAFLALLGALYRLRIQQVTRHVRVRLEARLEERERIARDLHDTLLQGVQGLILKFDAIGKKTAEEPTRRAIEETLDRADEILAEGRDRVRTLRGAAISPADLPAAFQRVAKEAAQESGATFKSVVEGHERELDPIVLEETFSIGREALLNALTHSGGLNVEIEITYDPRHFRLRIRDDGRGIHPEILAKGGRSDHWGLQGMRERARKIGAQLELWSRPGAGTEVELRVPAATAYRAST